MRRDGIFVVESLNYFICFLIGYFKLLVRKGKRKRILDLSKLYIPPFPIFLQHAVIYINRLTINFFSRISWNLWNQSVVRRMKISKEKFNILLYINLSHRGALPIVWHHFKMVADYIGMSSGTYRLLTVRATLYRHTLVYFFFYYA